MMYAFSPTVVALFVMLAFSLKPGDSQALAQPFGFISGNAGVQILRSGNVHSVSGVEQLFSGDDVSTKDSGATITIGGRLAIQLGKSARLQVTGGAEGIDIRGLFVLQRGALSLDARCSDCRAQIQLMTRRAEVAARRGLILLVVGPDSDVIYCQACDALDNAVVSAQNRPAGNIGREHINTTAFGNNTHLKSGEAVGVNSDNLLYRFSDFTQLLQRFSGTGIAPAPVVPPTGR